MSKTAVILAGGLGKRLQPLTTLVPKPLLPIGESTVLEIQIRSLAKCGITNIIIATYYMSEYVRNRLGDGNRYGVQISFSQEKRPLGTCGPLSLLAESLIEPFLVVNGDILTRCDFRKVYEYGLHLDSDLTVVTTEISAPFDFGNVICNGNYVADIQEKPKLKLEILAGIYLVKPPVLKMIPVDSYYGIDELIKMMIAQGKKVGRYLMQEYWLDIGRMDDYAEAQTHYDRYFAELSGEGS